MSGECTGHSHTCDARGILNRSMYLSVRREASKALASPVRRASCNVPRIAWAQMPDSAVPAAPREWVASRGAKPYLPSAGTCVAATRAAARTPLRAAEGVPSRCSAAMRSPGSTIPRPFAASFFAKSWSCSSREART